MSENKVNEPEDGEMIKLLPRDKICAVTSSWRIVKLMFLRKPDAAPKDRDEKLQGYCIDVCDLARHHSRPLVSPLRSGIKIIVAIAVMNVVASASGPSLSL